MTQSFGTLPSGEGATLYTISGGSITASITNFGATLVRLLVPDAAGNIADVVLGLDDCNGYRTAKGSCGATVGRSVNRIANATFALNGTTFQLAKNNGPHNLHSGPDVYPLRLWQTIDHTDTSVTFQLNSPDGDQGYPGNAVIQVTYSLDSENGLHICYDAVSDKDTIFNLTNHSYFNLAGHEKTDAAIHQLLQLSGRVFCVNTEEGVPTGELRDVAATPMDFRTPKPLSQDIYENYPPLLLQNGYDHNWEVYCNPCAVLTDPVSGRSMAISTDRPGIQLYTGNFLDINGKNGVHYGKHSGIALEPQFYPDAIHHPQWAQPVAKANVPYHSESVYRFRW